MNRLDKIEARANAATEGPWMGIRYPDGFLGRVIGGNGFGVAEDFPDDADAEFIAHARTDVPALVAALRAVLNLHFKAQPIPAAFGTQEGGDYCVTCAEDWPCPTVTAIRQHLGEGV